MPNSRKALVQSGIFTDKELEGRIEVEYEKFTKKVQIEARALGDIAINHIVPTAVAYMTTLIDNVKGLKEIFSDDEFERLAETRKDVIMVIAGHISGIKKLVNDMIEERKKANMISDSYEKALAYESKVKPYLSEIRLHIDKLELVVDNEIWPLPKYRELLFTC
jgi:glutamine synthetase